MNDFLLHEREITIDLYQLGNYNSNLCPELKYANMFFAIIVVHIECNPNPAHFRWHNYVYADRNMSSSTLQWIINDFFSFTAKSHLGFASKFCLSKIFYQIFWFCVIFYRQKPYYLSILSHVSRYLLRRTKIIK